MTIAPLHTSSDGLSPAALDKDVSTAPMLPARRDPHRMLAGRKLPASRRPDIGVAVPSVITGDPNVTRARSHNAVFNDRMRRRGFHNNLLSVSGADRHGSGQQCFACDGGRKLMKKGCSENRVACLSMLQTIADAGNVSAFE